jgi:hypothetical protein
LKYHKANVSRVQNTEVQSSNLFAVQIVRAAIEHHINATGLDKRYKPEPPEKETQKQSEKPSLSLHIEFFSDMPFTREAV